MKDVCNDDNNSFPKAESKLNPSNSIIILSEKR